MAKIVIGDDTVQIKAVKRTHGIESDGFIANIYINNKKVGSYSDYGDGARGNWSADNKEAEKKIWLLAAAYAEKNPNEYIVNMYKNEPEKYKVDRNDYKKAFPYIPEEKLTINVVSALDFDHMIYKLFCLYEDEKEFKKALKQGYKWLASGLHGSIMYPETWSEEKYEKI